MTAGTPVDAAAREVHRAPVLACGAGTRRTLAPAPEPTWWCTRTDGTRHGPFVTLFPDDSVAISGSYRDGALDGAWERRHPSGGIAEAGTYAGGIPTGTWRQLSVAGEPLGEYELAAGTGLEQRWYDSGAPYRQIARKAGLEHGTAKTFTPAGALIASARYADGKLHGAYVAGTQRTLRFEESYVRGVRSGRRRIWQYGYVIADENFDTRGRHHGAYRLWRSHSVPRVKGQFAHGKRIGAWVWHDREHRKEREGSYVAGKQDGRWTSWWDDKVVFTASYVAGKPDGVVTYYDRNGNELGSFSMTGGTGTMMTFHGNRKPATKQRLVKGVEDGPYQELTPRGQVTVSGRYRAGHKHGAWKEWTADGVLVVEQTWKRGRLDGPLKKYVDGKLSLEASYLDGQVDGPYTELRDDKPAVTGAFAADRKHGTWTHYAGDGAVVLTATYEHGVLDGPWRQLIAGTVLEGTMRAGRRAGTWTETTRAGVVRKLAYETP